MPPLAVASCNARRIASALLTPCTAVTPDRSVMVPTRISLSVTPCTGPAAVAAPVVAANAAAARNRRSTSAGVMLDILPNAAHDHSEPRLFLHRHSRMGEE